MTSTGDGGEKGLCDFCRLPISREAVTLGRGGEEYDFCTEACRDAMLETDRAFTEYHGFRRIRTGVSGLDRFLPEGFPRNSFVLVSNAEERSADSETERDASASDHPDAETGESSGQVHVRADDRFRTRSSEAVPGDAPSNDGGSTDSGHGTDG